MFVPKLWNPKGKRLKCELCMSRVLKVFSANDSDTDRIYMRAYVREWTQYATQSSRNLFIRDPRYTLDVTSLRTIRKNTNRRESYEGGGISSSPTAITRVRVCTKHDIPALRQPLTVLPSLVTKPDHLLPETLPARKAIATRIHLPSSSTKYA